MTPDQIYFRLCDAELLKETTDGRRTRTISAAAMAGRTLKARTRDGKLVEGKVHGMSLASRLAAEAEARRKEEKRKERNKARRRG